jgi:hypothetical protein
VETTTGHSTVLFESHHPRITKKEEIMYILTLLFALLAPSANALPLHKLCTEPVERPVNIVYRDELFNVVDTSRTARFAGRKFEDNLLLTDKAGNIVSVGGTIKQSKRYRVHEGKIWKTTTRKLGKAPADYMGEFVWFEDTIEVANLIIGDESWFSVSCETLTTW